jgi:hypothetical protein
MKSRFLFPYYWRIIGYLCFIADILFAIALKVLHPEGYAAVDLHQVTGSGMKIHHDIYQGVITMRLHHDIIVLLIVFGLLFIAFSKEKIEDEHIAQLRLDSLQWAIYLNYGIFIICVLFVYGLYFIPVVIFNVITPLIFFIIRLRWKIYQLNRRLKNEESR